MSVKKKYLKSKPLCKVTFNLSKDIVNGAKEVALVGDFNNWSIKKAETLRKAKDGKYTRTLDLATGKNYQYRFVLDGETWVNDTEAEGYAPSGVGPEPNCVVEV